MNVQTLIDKISKWVSMKFTGIVSIHFNKGGIRRIKVEYEITE